MAGKQIYIIYLLGFIDLYTFIRFSRSGLVYSSRWLYILQLYTAGNFEVVISHKLGNEFIRISEGFYRFLFLFLFLFLLVKACLSRW